jgi:hypothetical protein
MTLIELSIGLMITSLVVGALAALWFAVADTWQRSSASQNLALTANQALTRLETALKQSKYLCHVDAGSIDGTATSPASILVWKGDYWNPAGANAADGVVQVGELIVIEHDPVAKKIYLYQPIPAASMTSSQRTAASTVWIWDDLRKGGSVSTFKKLDYVKKTVMCECVAGMLVNVPATTASARPLIEFTLSVTRPQGTLLVYGSAALRAASQQPS